MPLDLEPRYSINDKGSIWFRALKYQKLRFETMVRFSGLCLIFFLVIWGSSSPISAKNRPKKTRFCRDQNTQSCPDGLRAIEFTVPADKDCPSKSNREDSRFSQIDISRYEFEDAEFEVRKGNNYGPKGKGVRKGNYGPKGKGARAKGKGRKNMCLETVSYFPFYIVNKQEYDNREPQRRSLFTVARPSV